MPDGATWRLSLWGYDKRFRWWGFSRTAPGDITLCWSGGGGSRRQHSTPESAVDELERRLADYGPAWRARDEEKAAMRARVKADMERIKAAIPDGFEWTDYGLGSGCWRIGRRYNRDEPPSPIRNVYQTDLYRYPDHADRIIEEISEWTWPPAPKDEPEEVDAEAETSSGEPGLFT